MGCQGAETGASSLPKNSLRALSPSTRRLACLVEAADLDLAKLDAGIVERCVRAVHHPVRSDPLYAVRIFECIGIPEVSR